MSNKTWNSEKVLSFAAMFISVMTLVVLVVQTRLMQAQQRLSVLPYLQISNYGSYTQNYKLMVLNNGIGPAFIESVTIRYQGKEYNKDLYTFLAEHFPETDSIPQFFHTNLGKGMLIPPGEKIAHLQIDNSVAGGEKLTRLLRRLGEEGLIFELVYSSVYKEKWRLRFGDEAAVKIK